MNGNNISHWNVLSSISSTNLTPFYTTLNNNEVISFVGSDGIVKDVNSLTVWTEASDLYIDINTSGYCVLIPANSSISLDYLNIKNIKVMANAGAKLRWLAMYY